jgi:hypothetical protein
MNSSVVPSGLAPRVRGLVVCVVCAVLVPLAALAQQRPLQTQDPTPVGAGQILVEAGVDAGSDILFPTSGLQGTLVRAPVLGLMFGVSSIAQIELTGGPYQRLAIDQRFPAPLAGAVTATGTSTSSVVDLAIGAKILVLSETASRPAVAFRFSTRLPNSKHPSGLGLNTTDFLAGFAVGKSVGPVRVVGNIGLGILPDPVSGQSQNDVLTYGASVSRQMGRGLEILGEVNGRSSVARGVPPPGTESRNAFLAGARYRRGSAWFDAAVVLGTTPQDPGVGVTAGVTWIFKAWTM